jgi:endonuclease/exonuclease/phosphatase family metal-dependent hydrolase
MRSTARMSAALLIVAACSTPDFTGPAPTTSVLDGLAPPEMARSSLTVLSRNLYFGADLDVLFVPGVDFGAAALEAWETIQYTDFPARAQALAQEIQQLRPHVIGLQEVVTYTVLSPQFQPIGQLSHLQHLLQELAALGLNYQIAVFTPHTTFTAPVGDLQNPAFYVNFLDAEAILVRADVTVLGAAAAIYAARVPLPAPIGIPILHAWQTVDVLFGGEAVRFANTHLETQSFPDVQEAQAMELIAALEGSPLPVVLVGDFNSAANRSAPEDRKTATYQMLMDAGFVDLWTRSGPSDKGLTCCHTGDLSNDASTFDQRLDLVLARNMDRGKGFAGGVAMDILGDEVDDRFATSLGYSLWPSDHAGIAATIWFPAGLVDR